MAYTYFDNFPIVDYNNKQMRNLLRNNRVITKLMQSSSSFYPVTLSEGDRIDNVAYNYYNDPNLAWLVMLSNDMVDPYYDWYLTTKQFNDFIIKKYGSLAAAQANTVYYEHITKGYRINKDSIPVYSGFLTLGVGANNSVGYNMTTSGSLDQTKWDGLHNSSETSHLIQSDELITKIKTGCEYNINSANGEWQTATSAPTTAVYATSEYNDTNMIIMNTKEVANSDASDINHFGLYPLSQLPTAPDETSYQTFTRDEFSTGKDEILSLVDMAHILFRLGGNNNERNTTGAWYYTDTDWAHMASHFAQAQGGTNVGYPYLPPGAFMYDNANPHIIISNQHSVFGTNVDEFVSAINFIDAGNPIGDGGISFQPEGPGANTASQIPSGSGVNDGIIRMLQLGKGSANFTSAADAYTSVSARQVVTDITDPTVSATTSIPAIPTNGYLSNEFPFNQSRGLRFINFVEKFTSSTRTISSGQTPGANFTAISSYTYEEELNEQRKHIRLLDVDLLPQVMSELKMLLGGYTQSDFSYLNGEKVF